MCVNRNLAREAHSPQNPSVPPVACQPVFLAVGVNRTAGASYSPPPVPDWATPRVRASIRAAASFWTLAIWTAEA